jgi:dipeptidyl aminopeptidase/acylaminoacyl peptidase
MKKFFLFYTVLALLLAGASQSAFAADDKPALESFFKDPDLVSAALSPLGHYVAMVKNMPDGLQALAVRDTADLKKLAIVTGAAVDQRIVAIHWINENRIGFTVKNLRYEFEGNWDEFAVDRDGGNLKHLISGNWHHHQDNTGSLVKDKVLTADYGFFRAAHDGSDDIIVEKYFFNGIDIHAEHTRLYRLNTRNQQLSDLLPGDQPANTTYWLLDAADAPRIAMSHFKGRCITSYRAENAATWAEMSNNDCYNNSSFTPLYFDGADKLIVKASYQGNEALYYYDLKQMKIGKEPFLSIPGFDYRGTPEIDRVSKKLLGIHLFADAITTVWFDAALKEIQNKVNAILPQTNNQVSCPSDCRESPVVLVTSASDRQPTEYFIYTPASGVMVKLGDAHPGIKPAQMGLRDFYHYSARDGRSIPVYVTVPPGKPTGPLPAVVLVHGGPAVRGSSWEWENEAQFLASRGYLVIQPEYRGGTGFGYAHFQAGLKQWGGTMQDDLADAAGWAVKKGWADPRRIGIMGASYGGYATLMGLINNPEIFRCGVEWAGVTDLNLMFDRPESDASQDSLAYDMKTMIGDPVADAAMLARHSPLPNAAKLTQPLLIAHGAEDLRVPIVHATKFRDAVEKTNPHVEWIVYSDEGHGWRHAEDNIDFWKHVEVFLDKNLKTAN